MTNFGTPFIINFGEREKGRKTATFGNGLIAIFVFVTVTLVVLEVRAVMQYSANLGCDVQ